MNEKQKLIRESMLSFLHQKQKGEKLTIDTLNELFDSGLFTDKSALKFVVKNEYFQLMKKDISGRSAIIDLSIKWDVTEYFIRDLIYTLSYKKKQSHSLAK